MGTGFQFAQKKENALHGLAVRNGQVSTVPVPGTMILLGSDLLGLVGLNRRKK
ncbi:MAG: PEP-CTERM sorting domain-containing protein [Desulfobacteraceae bacterium]|nr:PEP-CTERM sorting domain-containing protein [Desulfobacteraceae bacterium]